MYDTALADRVRGTLAPELAFTEMKMFGGLAFMVGGNMACGIVADDLMVRVGPEAYAECLLRPHARPMDFTGRTMKGMLFVGAAGLAGDDLGEWVGLGLEYAGSLPPKGARVGARRKPATGAATGRQTPRR